jgi:hypothetical protein
VTAADSNALELAAEVVVQSRQQKILRLPKKSQHLPKQKSRPMMVPLPQLHTTCDRSYDCPVTICA